MKKIVLFFCVLCMIIGFGISNADANHSGLTWTGSYAICQQCHLDKYNEVFGSVHYQWQGDALNIVNGTLKQGKISSSMNAYCVNILGNFGACGSCHTGLGAMPSTTSSQTQLNNIDCFLCHHKDYKRVKNTTTGLFEPAPGVDMNTIVKTVHKPVRSNCLQCHARAGGGDGVKRSLTLAHGTTGDSAYDVHMATTRGNLTCQACHKFTNHRVAGRGSELRPTDSTVAISCSTSTCHPTKMNSNGHSTAAVNRHVNRVACQTCHIPMYGKNASDTSATEATETHRDWRTSVWSATMNRYEPSHTLANNLLPVYRFFNRTSWVYNMKDPAVYDPKTAAYQVSRPVGAINDASTATKLYPFKYKTAHQPITTGLSTNVLIAISTKDYFATGDYDAAVKAGLTNMGYSSTTPYATIIADEYQMLNHQVAPKASALACSKCHPNATATQMKLVANLGYNLKAAKTTVCTQCHKDKKIPAYDRMHNNHVGNRKIKCSKCHTFDRPERTDLVN